METASQLKLIKYVVAYIENEFFKDVKDGRGYLKVPSVYFPLLSSVIWANLYEDRKKLRSLMPAIYLRCLPPDERAKMALLDKDGAQNLVDSFGLEAIAEFEGSEDPFAMELPTDQELETLPASKTPAEIEEDAVLIKLLACLLMTLYSTFLALMSFGQTMCDLVEKAKEGDDNAFCKAMQVDRTVLFGVPYFQQRLIRAQAGRELQFLKRIANAIKSPPLGDRLDHPMLMIVFYLLDDAKLLNMPLEELLDFCEELGVAGHGTTIKDTEALRKRRQFYLRRTGRQI